VFPFLLGALMAQSPASNRVDPLVAVLGKGFVSAIAKLNGATLHYGRGGTGPAEFLFPQDRYA
jgi:hypothetical protein